MNQVFLDYSKYYDLIYQDKAYQIEAEFILRLIRKHHPAAKTLLNIGCGTGKHDRFFAEAGFQVTGIDLSSEMLEIARASNKGDSFQYLASDARDFRANEPFDAVVSLFHVFSYQNSNDDALRFLTTLRSALKTDGVGIFDYWYGPAVIHQKPGSREKKVSSENLEVLRKTNSRIDYVKSVVEVDFEIKINQKNPPLQRILNESHHMRYFSCNELDLLAASSGLNASHFAWLSESRAPGIEDWNAYSVVMPC
ncbi:MAG: class I SAM-dependent methyltransferase [Bdellovibrionales bacterium]|nr:class I SAM-dependent methyltransferase [Bdellovibrionales bacterium]